MDIMSWSVFGLIAALIITIIDRHVPTSERMLGAIMLGVLGAVLGGLLGNVMFTTNNLGFDLASFILAITGSLVLLVVQRGVKRL
jgi:uncharacterized membrane protein YeaQ/YmgE (transglycosylase-associated protein family)